MFMIGTALCAVRFAEKQLGGKLSAAFVGVLAGMPLDVLVFEFLVGHLFGISFH